MRSPSCKVSGLSDLNSSYQLKEAGANYIKIEENSPRSAMTESAKFTAGDRTITVSRRRSGSAKETRTSFQNATSHFCISFAIIPIFNMENALNWPGPKLL